MTFRPSSELREQIKEHCRLTGQSQSQFILSAIKAALKNQVTKTIDV